MFATFFVFGIVLVMIPVAIGLTYLVAIAPRYILDYLVSRRRILLRDQMVRASVALANAARAGMSLPQGLDLVAKEAAEPLATEFRRITSAFHAGRPLSDALGDVQQRLQLEVFNVFTSAVLVCMERGGQISYALERISEDLQELQRLERKLEADTASGRRLTLLLACFPFAFLIGFTFLDPPMMGTLYHSFLGQIVLLSVGAVVYFAVRWCVWILDIDF